MLGSGGNAGGARPAAAAALLLALVLALVPAPEAVAAKRVALVVGNGAYAHAPKLANPVSDATAVGLALERLGFSVTRVENAGYDTLRRRLRDFGRASRGAEVAVAFYAGHGIEVGGRNYLVPVDAALANDGDTEFEAVGLDLVMRSVEGASRFGLVILDACRENPFVSRMERAGPTRAVGRGLARVEPTGVTLVAYAAAAGRTAADGSGRHSPYTAALLEHIAEPGLHVGQMFDKVRESVESSTGGEQKPVYYGALPSAGAYLSPSPPGGGVPAAVPDGESPDRLSAARMDAERAFWESADQGGTAADYEAYLDRYPSGAYARLAHNRLARLGDGGAISPSAPVPSGSDHAALESDLGLDRAARVLLQSGLGSLGFDVGPADGAVGPRTRRAISSWQSAKGYEATSYLTGEQAEALIAAGREARDRAEREAAEREEHAGRDRDDAAFAAARRSDTASAYEVYLSLYPSGAHVSEAERLRAAREAADREREDRAARARDDAAFARARQADTVSAYDGYLSAYRSGAHVSEARRLRDAAARDRLPAVGDVFRDCPDCPEMVVVPSGSFTMGSPSSEEGRYDNEGPRRRVTIGSPFAVGVYEVTRGEFGRFVSATGRSMGNSCWTWDGEWKSRPGRGWRNPGFSQDDSHPVVCVSWEDARAYAQWLSGETGEYYRLLSESEWEYVARGGTQTRYWWGDGSSSQCRYANGADASSGLDWGVDCDDGYSRTSPVGSFGGNSFGLRDVHGNVWEWVQDCWNEDYDGAPGDGRAWERGECSRRVLRGGSWDGIPRFLRAAVRGWSGSGLRNGDAGFRVARTFTP